MTSLSLLEWKALQFLLRPYKVGSNEYFPSYTVCGDAVFLTSVDLTADAKKAFKSIAAKGWTDVDSYGNHRANAAARHVFEAHPEKPQWMPPAPPALQERDWAVLHSLEYASRAGGWATPLELGGSNGSYHSASLIKLVRHGYVACRQRGGEKVIVGPEIIPEPRLTCRGRGSRTFQITDAGKQALEARTSR